mmetsp:Transcript_39990/g.103250  ORF Transcript_39990/g.103250 Transcript_39990/m.103250 type:complete len:162 (-) Transcript_39990:1305-1790(-)
MESSDSESVVQREPIHSATQCWKREGRMYVKRETDSPFPCVSFLRKRCCSPPGSLEGSRVSASKEDGNAWMQCLEQEIEDCREFQETVETLPEIHDAFQVLYPGCELQSITVCWKEVHLYLDFRILPGGNWPGEELPDRYLGKPVGTYFPWEEHWDGSWTL